MAKRITFKKHNKHGYEFIQMSKHILVNGNQINESRKNTYSHNTGNNKH